MTWLLADRALLVLPGQRRGLVTLERVRGRSIELPLTHLVQRVFGDLE